MCTEQVKMHGALNLNIFADYKQLYKHVKVVYKESLLS